VSPNSSVCTAMGYGLWAGRSEFESRAVSPGVRRQGREADHSLVSYEEIKKKW
jgi:hypothetical protein